MNDKIKAKFAELISSGLIQAHIEGPKNNILVCNSMNDWAIACGELCRSGFNALSPGGYGGSGATDRKNTYNKIWRSGTVCASVIEKKILCFTLSQTDSDYCHIYSIKE